MSGDLKETHKHWFFPWIWANRLTITCAKVDSEAKPQSWQVRLLPASLLYQRAMDSVEVTCRYLKFYPSDGQPVKTKGFSQVYKHRHEVESRELEEVSPELPCLTADNPTPHVHLYHITRLSTRERETRTPELKLWKEDSIEKSTINLFFLTCKHWCAFYPYWIPEPFSGSEVQFFPLNWMV